MQPTHILRGDVGAVECSRTWCSDRRWPARAHLLVGENNFLVFELAEGATEYEIGQLLAHRVLVTGRLEHFQEIAAINEYSIIDTADFDHDASSCAAEISRLWLELGLEHSKGWALRLRREGPSTLDDIE